jgi:chorismate synthase
MLEAKGQHDPCVVPLAVLIVESMAALVVRLPASAAGETGDDGCVGEDEGCQSC